MKKYMMIFLGIPLWLCAGGEPVPTSDLSKQYTKHSDSGKAIAVRASHEHYTRESDRGLDDKSKLESIKELEKVKEPTPPKPFKIIAFLLKCCCGTQEIKD